MNKINNFIVDNKDPILASTNASIDKLLDFLETATLINPPPSKDKIQSVETALTDFEDIRKKILAGEELNGIQCNQILIILNQTKVDLKHKELMVSKSLTALDSILKDFSKIILKK